jgi:hypothetical protein
MYTDGADLDGARRHGFSGHMPLAVDIHSGTKLHTHGVPSHSSMVRHIFQISNRFCRFAKKLAGYPPIL